MHDECKYMLFILYYSQQSYYPSPECVLHMHFIRVMGIIYELIHYVRVYANVSDIMSTHDFVGAMSAQSQINIRRHVLRRGNRRSA